MKLMNSETLPENETGEVLRSSVCDCFALVTLT
jgi:hypothetical protein